MPKKLERKLARTARARHYGKKRTAAYVYGTMNKRGLLKSSGSHASKVRRMMKRG